jgi:GNAT superfamily N-acetyltransferase
MRELQPTDGPAIDALIAASPDTGMIRFRPVFQVDPFVAMTYGDIWAGVVVEREGSPGLVGLGMVSFGELVLRGERRPYALLHSLVVHPSVRRQGVAARIIDARLDLARDRAGEDAVIVASIQRSNEGSFAAASRWATQFSEPLDAVVMGVRSTPPSARRDWQVRPAVEGDLEAFAHGFAEFRRGYDLSVRGDAQELADWLDRTPTPGVRIHELWVVEDSQRNVLAGLGVAEVRRSTYLKADSLPASIRALNKIVRIIPSDNTMQMVPASHVWFAPGAETAASYLFESMRCEARSRGNVVNATYDPRSPIRTVVSAPRWLPRTSFSVAIRAPERLRPDHPIDPVQ